MNAVTSPGEAFFVAAEMERRAVRLYERASALFSGTPCAALIRDILSQEREHLTRFSSFLAESGYDVNDPALLSAQSARVIFSGGLVEAHRLGAFESEASLLRYAMDQERGAIETYERFAALLAEGDGRAPAFTKIAEEEKKHLSALKAQLEAPRTRT